MHVKLLSIPVSDQESAKGFYVDKVGMTVLVDNTWGDDQRWVQVGWPGAQTSLTLVTWFDEMPAGCIRGLVLESDDLDRDVRAMTERGVRFLGDPIDQPGGRFASFRDLDGNRISLRQADDR
ncbi:MAG TPA: VOC family protein [Acidimicrobiales bacterium]|nr:VOC family protein [Acidimicrobiales bacterium]